MLDIINIIHPGVYNSSNFLDLIKLLNYVQQPKNKIEVQFLSSISHKFPKTEIETIEIESHNKDTFKIKIVTNFLGLIGPTGILPSHYTEFIIAQSKEKDFSLPDFLNIFYDKIIKLFIKIVKKSSVYFEYEAYSLNQTNYNKQNWVYIYSLIGINYKNAEQVIPSSLLNYAGLLINTSRPAHILKTILTDYLQVPVEIEEFIAEKQKLEKEELSRLGKRNNQLTDSLYLGDIAYFYQSKVIIKIFELDLKRYELFLTDRFYRKPLEQILTFYLKDNLHFEIIFLVKESEKTALLSIMAPRKLGVTMWCKN